MDLIPFPEQTNVIAKDQPQYRPMPAHIFQDDPQGKVAFCWKLTLKERLRVLLTGTLWQQVLTFNHPLQPQLLDVKRPKMKSRYPFRAWTCFRLCVTWCMQAQGAPFMEQATVNEYTGLRYKGYVFVLKFWKMGWGNWGTSKLCLRTTEPTPALVIAWKVKEKPQPAEPCSSTESSSA